MTRSGFSLPDLGNFGTAPRRFFHGPGLDNWNLALHKDTAIREGMTLQIRAEFFNAFNHTEFNSIGTTYQWNAAGVNLNTTTGQFTATQPARQMALTARFEF